MEDKTLENIAKRLRHALFNDVGDGSLRREVLEIVREIENRLAQDEALRGQK